MLAEAPGKNPKGCYAGSIASKLAEAAAQNPEAHLTPNFILIIKFICIVFPYQSMKRVLFTLLAMAVLFAQMSIELEQLENSNIVEYTVTATGVRDGTLKVSVFSGNRQVSVQTVNDFDGVAKGFLTLSGSGAYKVKVLETTTDAYTETEFTFSEPSIQASTGPEFISGGEIPEWVGLLGAALAIIVVILIIFGNPLSQKKKEAAGRKRRGKK